MNDKLFFHVKCSYLLFCILFYYQDKAPYTEVVEALKTPPGSLEWVKYNTVIFFYEHNEINFRRQL